jgi:HNH endonuclease
MILYVDMLDRYRPSTTYCNKLMKYKPLPELDRLKELFTYDSESGQLIARISRKGPLKAGMPVGSLTNKGYLNTKVDGKHYPVSRIIWKLLTGEDPGDSVVDHIDMNKLNNRFSNLRLATGAENNCNCRARSHNSSGLKGVKRRPCGTYYAYIRLGANHRYLGTYQTKEEAHAAYCRAAAELHGQYARTH